MNWYVYCSNNPLNRTDPTGLREIEISPREDEAKDRAERKIEAKVEALKELNEGKGIKINKSSRIARLRNELQDDLKDYKDSGYDTEWIKKHTEIEVTRGVYGTPGDDDYDGRLDLKFMGQSIFEMKVQTWADNDDLGYGDGTLKPKVYDGSLKDRNLPGHGKFKDYIIIRGAFYIHPNAWNFKSDKPYYRSEEAGSAGCVIPKIQDFNNFTDLMKGVGFEYKRINRDSIKITIKLADHIQAAINNQNKGILLNIPLTPEEDNIKRHTLGYQ